MVKRLCKGDLLCMNNELYVDSGSDHYIQFELQRGDYVIFLHRTAGKFPEFTCVSRFGVVVAYYWNFKHECTMVNSRKKIVS